MTTLIATLLSNAVTVTVLAFVVFVVSKKIRSQRLVHGLWVILLLKLITPSFISLPFAFPIDESWLTINPGFLTGDVVSVHQSSDRSHPTMAGLMGDSESIQVSAAGLGIGLAGESGVSQLTAGVPADSQNQWLTSWPRMIVSVLLLTWLTGSCVCVVRLLVRYFRFCSFLRKNELIDEELISEGYDLAYRMGLQRPPRVRVLSGVFSPMLCGLGRGVTLILPLDLLHRLTPEGRATLVVHELSHYARGDYLVRVLETIALAIFWWHPIVWWIRRELEIVEEDCCDSRVLAEFPGQPRHYAEAILDAIDFLSECPAALPPMSSGLGTTPLLKRRLTRIMTEAPVSESPQWGHRVVLACAFAVLPLQTIQFRSEPVAIIGANEATRLSETVAGSVDGPPELSAQEIDSILAAPVWSRVRSPDGRWMVLVDHEQHCRLFSPIERSCLELPTTTACCAVFSPNSQCLAVGTTDGRLLILRCPDWTVEFNIGRGPAVRSIDWSPNGDRLAFCTESGDLKLLASHDMSIVAQRRLPMSSLNCLRFSPNGQQLIVGCGDWKTNLDSALLLLDAESLNLNRVWNAEVPIAFARWSDQNQEIICCDWSGRMNLHSLTDLKILNSQWIPKDLIAPLTFSIQADDAGMITGAF